MIRIERVGIATGYVPNGEDATKALQDARAADPLAGASAARGFNFLKSVYGPKRIKTALSRAQFEKCCYCENYFAGNYAGDVEHFRPKGRIKERRGAPFLYPGYFWLAYRWDNLLYSCSLCNSSGKGELFPIADPCARAMDDAGLQGEGALLIDPTREDPREHIAFEFITPKPLSERGEATIEVLKLARPELRPPRLSHLKAIDSLLRLANKPDTPEHADDRAHAIAQLNIAALSNAVFSSMTRDFLTARGWPPVAVA